eukprot:m.120155 g.120155  ORF g.120155 m.120155 type:complete len:50 (+) comp15607_c0_seq5:1473-1622(+)
MTVEATLSSMTKPSKANTLCCRPPIVVGLDIAYTQYHVNSAPTAPTTTI